VDGVKTIGLVGGIGSGKSSVAEMLGKLGAGVISADAAGHAVLAEEPAVQDAIRQRWGSGVFAADGSVDRSAVAQRVFAPGRAGKEDLRFLERLVHPLIRQRLLSQLKALSAQGRRAIVIDAALLFEAGWHDLCNIIVFIDAPRPVRLARARRRGWADDQFDARDAAQWPVDEKRRRADAVLENNGTLDNLRQAVGEFWEKYVVAEGS
jgi:dephospho-CoA kinase